MNSYCLRHPKTQTAIHFGILQSIHMAKQTTSKLGWSLVKNASGGTLMHVRYSRVGQLTELRFFDKHLQDISDTVKKALRSVEK